MQLLLFSDIHNDHDACDRLVERASDVDVVVGAGDFCTMRRGLSPIIDRLSAITTPTVLVPGNSESVDELQDACTEWEAAHVLHGEAVTLSEQPFFGIGGGIPITPFGAWSYDFSEDEATALLRDCPDGAVLVSHSPPRNVVDQDSRGQHLGSTAVRTAIERTSPRLTVCGHIHGSWGQTGKLASTPVVNAGPSGRTWDLDAS